MLKLGDKLDGVGEQQVEATAPSWESSRVGWWPGSCRCRALRGWRAIAGAGGAGRRAAGSLSPSRLLCHRRPPPRRSPELLRRAPSAARHRGQRPLGMLRAALARRGMAQGRLTEAQAARSGSMAAFRPICLRTRGSRESVSIVGERETFSMPSLSGGRPMEPATWR